jgi:hypothetical protein
MNGAAITSASTPAVRRRAVFLWMLLALGAVVYMGFFAVYPDLFMAVGVNYLGVWFLDSFAILASNDALARGLDVYAFNPLDYLQRPHVYSHWWLGLGKFGLTRADNFWVGLTLVVGFLLVALAKLRPATPRELLWYLAVLCSSPVLLAVHRANNDLVVFLLLAPLVPCLLSGKKAARLVAVLLVAFATALKFYPLAAALVLLAGHSTPVVRRGLVVAVLALGLVAAGLAPDLARMSVMLQHTKAEGLMTFGAGNFFDAIGVSGWAALATGGAVVLAAAAAFSRSRLFSGWEPAAHPQPMWLNFVLGASLLTACFFTGRNFAYRWIFALWLAPFLWRCWHDPATPLRVRRFAAVTAGLLLVVLWADPFATMMLTRLVGKIPGEILLRWIGWFFMAEQPFAWAFFVCLIGWLAHFSLSSVRRLFGGE